MNLHSVIEAKREGFSHLIVGGPLGPPSPSVSSTPPQPLSEGGSTLAPILQIGNQGSQRLSLLKEAHVDTGWTVLYKEAGVCGNVDAANTLQDSSLYFTPQGQRDRWVLNPMASLLVAEFFWEIFHTK